jgi:hypothetical protein
MKKYDFLNICMYVHMYLLLLWPMAMGTEKFFSASELGKTKLISFRVLLGLGAPAPPLTADKKNDIRVGREPSRSSIDKVGGGEGKVRNIKLKARGWKIETGIETFYPGVFSPKRHPGKNREEMRGRN